MNRERPGILAVRAVNQYRRRDVLTYLALRYYLHNDAARTDRWVEDVATNLVLTRSDLPYFHALHFKDSSGRGKIDHRAMFLPSANEALAEAALLAECAKHQQAFSNPSCVFSYSLNHGNDRSGIFPHYSPGLRERHDAIAKACDADQVLMKTATPFIRELACLHGVTDRPRHPEGLEFDEDEDLAMYTIDQLQQSLSP